MTGILSCEGQKAQRASSAVLKVQVEVAARGASPLAVLARRDGRHGDGGSRKGEGCRRTWGRARARGEAEQDTQQQLQQEHDELQLTIQRLVHQLYGRRREWWQDAAGQQRLDFGDGDVTALDPSIISAAFKEVLIGEHLACAPHRAPHRVLHRLAADRGIAWDSPIAAGTGAVPRRTFRFRRGDGSVVQQIRASHGAGVSRHFACW